MVVPNKLKERISRFLRDNAEKTDAVFGSLVTDSIDVGSADVEQVSVGRTVDKVKLTTDQTLSNQTTTKVEFNSVTEDTLNDFDATNHVWDISRDGTYILIATIKWVNGTFSAGDRLTARFVKNGSFLHDPENRWVGNTTEMQSVFTVTTTSATSGDTIRLDAFQDSGDPQDIRGSTPPQTTASVVKIG